MPPLKISGKGITFSNPQSGCLSARCPFVNIYRVAKNGTIVLYALTLPNINLFS